MLPLIERDVVERHKWLSHEEFIDLFAVAQSLPGVFAVNISIFVGYRLAGKRGGTIAALGTILPSFVIIFESAKSNPHIAAIMQGIRPAVVALIAVPVYTTWRTMRLSNRWLIVPILTALLVWFFGVSPILIILVSGGLGILYREGLKRKLKQQK